MRKNTSMNHVPMRGFVLLVALIMPLLLGSLVFVGAVRSQESLDQFVPATPTMEAAGEPDSVTPTPVWITPTMSAVPGQESGDSGEPSDTAHTPVAETPTVRQGGYSGGPESDSAVDATQAGLVKPAVPTIASQAAMHSEQATLPESPDKIAVVPHRYAQHPQDTQPDQAPLYSTPNALAEMPADGQTNIPQFVPALVEGAPVRRHVVLPQQPTPIVLSQQPTPTPVVVAPAAPVSTVVIVEPTTTDVTSTPTHTEASTVDQEAIPRAPIIGYESQLLDTQESVLVDVGMPAPDFAFTLTDDSTHTLRELRGKKVLINFMATWCAHCNDEMPHIQRAGVEFFDDGLVVLGIVADERVEMIESFAQHHQVTFPLIADPSGAIRNRYGVEGFPKSYFINPEGIVVAIHLGSIDRDTIAQIIEQM